VARSQLRILAPKERRRIIDEAFALLADTGADVARKETRTAFQRAGAKVGPNDRVRLPVELARELLAPAPASHVRETIAGERIHVGAGGQLVTSLVLDPVIVDCDEGPRPPRLSDVTRHARLGDALPRVNATYKMDQHLEGMTPAESNVRSICEFLCNTTCHVHAQPADGASLATWIEMMEIVLDGATFKERPVLCLGGHMKSPLRLPAFECDLIAAATAREIPMIVGACPMAGATSPFTLAGTLTLAVAETIFMTAAVQVHRQSHPVLAGSSLFPFNMKTGNVSAGGVETSLLEAAYAELVRELSLPVGITFTFNDPAEVDFQAGLETALKGLSAVLANPDCLSGLGSIANARGVSAEKIVLDHDLLESATRFRDGIRVNEDTLAAAALRDIGAGGDFLACDHTLAHLRSGEHYYGGLFHREGEPPQTMLERAHDRVRELLDTRAPAVPEQRQQALRRQASRERGSHLKF